MRKLIASLTFAAVVALSAPVSVYADEYSNEGDCTTEVTYSVAPSYTVKIPASITLSNNEVEESISVSNVVIAKDEMVVVRLSSARAANGTEGMKVSTGTSSDETVNYTIKRNSGTDLEVGDIILGVRSVTTEITTLVFNAPESSDVMYAGEYSGTLTFTISVE